ncbi:hypothetical protein [uncultured Anaerococcus sp.]|uniref:hypothetical protein n=2 Tax=Anaerococcus TaxID=165779 RepID=UPI0025DC9EA6|nr:hypothetical protein [uncultured Anaerococcus sp.]
MLLFSILGKINLKSKFSFYQKFFSLETQKPCYIVFFAKEFLTLLFTSIFLYYFLNNIEIFNININLVKILILMVIFVNLSTTNKTNINFLQNNLDLYRINSTTYPSFLKKTITPIYIIDFIFNISSLIPIIVGAVVWDRKLVFYIVPVFILSYFSKIGSVNKEIKKNYNSGLALFIKVIKVIFAIVFTYLIVSLVFSLVGETINIIKLIINSNSFEEDVLLSDLMESIKRPISIYKYYFFKYKFFILLVLILYVIINIINNLRNYRDIWLNKILILDGNIVSNKYIKSDDKLPLIKRIYSASLDNLASQVLKIPEYMVVTLIELMILNNQKNDMIKITLIIWLFYISNSNFIRSLYVTLANEFTNYDIRTDVYYFRLASKPILDIYNNRVNCLNNYTKKMLFVQIILQAVFSIIYIDNKIFALMLIFIIIFLAPRIQIFNCKLATFSRFLNFAISSQLDTSLDNSEESSFIDEKMQNLFKLPFTIIPMLILIIEYISEFLNIYYLLFLVVIFIITGSLIDKQMDATITKGGNILERINVID